jgi:flagellar hook-length control protein FliK
VAINTNALTLSSAPPAKSSFHPDADPGSQTSSAAAATTQDGVGDGPVQGGSTAQKATGPSAQTRANARAARPPATTAGPAGGTPGTDTAATTADASANFGSVLASALGRSAATAETLPPTKAATSATDSNAAPAQPAAPPAADAVAWIAQALAPPAAVAAAVAQPGTTPVTAQANGGTGSQVGSVTGATVATAAPATAGVVLPPGAPAGPAATTSDLTTAAAAQALRTRSNAAPLQQLPTPPSAPTSYVLAQTQAAPSATTLGSLNAMADAQKLIAGMTSANTSDADQDSNEDLAGAPAPHVATAAGSTDGTQAAIALQASALTRTDSTQGGITLSIQAPVGATAFADEVSARVTGLAQSGITQAQLQLSPADLGPVQVHITLQAGAASVWFGANHADTRAALEQSLPRLRELFAGAGMPLTDSGVFREPPQQQSAQSLPGPANSHPSGSDTPSAATVTQVSNIRLSLLDTYA